MPWKTPCWRRSSTMSARVVPSSTSRIASSAEQRAADRAAEAVLAGLRRGEALHLRGLSLEDVDRLAQGHLLGRVRERVTAARPPGAAHQPGTAQGHQQLVEEGAGHVLASGDVVARDRRVAEALGEVEKGADAVGRLP